MTSMISTVSVKDLPVRFSCIYDICQIWSTISVKYGLRYLSNIVLRFSCIYDLGQRLPRSLLLPTLHTYSSSHTFSARASPTDTQTTTEISIGNHSIQTCIRLLLIQPLLLRLQQHSRQCLQRQHLLLLLIRRRLPTPTTIYFCYNFYYWYYY